MELIARPSRSRADDVAYRILSEIRRGRYKPGDRLPTEPDLARRLGVGRTSVREGLGQLRMLGIVEVRRGVGTYVRQRQQADAQLAFHEWTATNQYEIIDLFEVRMALEASAAALAAQRTSTVDVADLMDRAQAHAQAHLGGDLSALVGTDEAFHGALVSTSQNAALQRVYDGLVSQFREYRRKSLALEGASERSSRDHLAIVEAVRQRDPAEARAAVLRHLGSLYRELIHAGRIGLDGSVLEVPFL